MQKVTSMYLILLLIFAVSGAVLFSQEGNNMDYKLLDDFAGERSQLDTEWKGFTDQVMGGESEMQVVRLSEGDGTYMRMSGVVSLENNGGFIQVRLKLKKGLSRFDAGDYRGFRLKVRGAGQGYYLHARTSATVLPWKFYSAAFQVNEDWGWVDVPFSAFQPGYTGKLSDFNPRKLKSVAVVAFGKSFQARLDVAEIGLYR